MFRFIIIENDINYVNIYKEIIEKTMFSNNIPYKIYTFDSYNSDLKNLIVDENGFKIYLMAVELTGNKSGLDIAKSIRNYDWDSEIIFITNHDNMFELVHRNVYKVFAFIEKFENMNKRIKDVLLDIINMKKNNDKFLYCNSKENIQIYFKDILYIYTEKSERKLAIVTNKKTFFINLSLKEALEKCDNKFKQVHRACIVNTNMVDLYNWNEGYFILKNGEKINLCSKNYKNNIV